MNKLISSVIFIFFISAVFVSATGNCPPSIPKTYFGNVSHNGAGLAGNFEIRAKIGEDVAGINNVSEGIYTIDVSPCAGVTGEVIFFINGVEANQKGTYSGVDDWGKEVKMDLTISALPSSGNLCGNAVVDLGEECDGVNLAGRSADNCGSGWTGTISCSSSCLIDYANCNLAAFCGDAVCNNLETCSSCAVDCGACPVNNNGGGGNSPGGGGGGSSAQTSQSLIHVVSNEQIADGISKEINPGDKIKFSLEGEQHTLNLDAVTGNFARITVQSEPITFVLEAGNDKKIDFENDNFYDLRVELEGITGGKAKIKIKSIHEEVPQIPIANNETAGNETAEGETAGITGGVIGFAKSGKGIGLIAGLIIVIAGIGIAMKNESIKKKFRKIH